ncbi:hypothetical protein MtrunA17_Chr6g0464251 [Medicago truncatula]|uniref:Uncharacterized protein n=1 Tax=Medicago truncatula TaxID=3880 RepID=A0A396HII6_MEDTR|nr:hypothetical protein MtrunA17_Chr6g0464251 [Medicago truncatula]
MKHFSDLYFQRIQSIFQTFTNNHHIFNFNPNFLFFLFTQRKFQRISQFIHPPSTLLNLLNLPQKSTTILSLPLLRLLQNPLVQ